jgi:hypothetical protein
MVVEEIRGNTTEWALQPIHFMLKTVLRVTMDVESTGNGSPRSSEGVSVGGRVLVVVVGDPRQDD